MFQKYRYLTSLFDRPGVKSLLEMAREQKINCIVVKDFSRFGRNYLEVGNYLEQVFPFLGIRFLSVGDNFDSSKDCGAAGAIDVGFKNIFYAAYSNDLSIKIRSVRKSKAEQGQFVTAFAPYGYCKDIANKNRIIIDDECAVVVCRIYDLFLQGLGKTGIAKLLNREDVPSPMMVRKNRRENFTRYQCNEHSHWTVSTVSAILADRRYTGDAVYGKVKPQSVGSKKDVSVPKEDWIIVPNAHDAIIEREIFETVQATKRTHNYKRKNEEAPLAKKVICRVCNHALKRICRGAEVYFHCTTKSNTDKYDCNTNSFLEQSLGNAILDYLQALSSTMQEVSFEAKQQVKPTSVSVLEKIKILQKATLQKETGVLKIYEAYKANQLSRESYLRQMECVETEIAFLREQLAQYEKDYQMAIQNQKPVTSSDYERVKKYAPFTSLSKEIADEFVEAIYIESNGVVTVQWRFADPLTSSFDK